MEYLKSIQFRILVNRNILVSIQMVCSMIILTNLMQEFQKNKEIQKLSFHSL